MTRKFQPGTTYQCRSIGDHECIFSFTVVKRTAKFITILDTSKEEARVGVRLDWEGNEIASPLGRYSMAPVIRA